MRSVAHQSELWGLTGSRGLTLAKRGWLTCGDLHLSDLALRSVPLQPIQSAAASCHRDPPAGDFDAAKAALHDVFARSDRAMGTSWRVGQSASAARVDRLTN
jgi:hypothetical protein